MLIRRIEIENFRLFERLVVEDLGRVNIIIGANNAGKTAFIEAMALAASPTAIFALLDFYRARSRKEPNHADYARVWQSLFRDNDGVRGFMLGSGTHTQRVRESSDLENAGRGWGLKWEVDGLGSLTARPGPREMYFDAITPGFPIALTRRACWHIASGPTLDDSFVSSIDMIKRDGRDEELLSLLATAVPGIDSFEFLEGSELGARASGEKLLRPITMFGDGTQRAFEIGAAVTRRRGDLLTIDEIENGFHFAALAPLWRWLRDTTARTGTQLAVTTHRDECVLAACEAFRDAGDDDIRVIRLDRERSTVKAATYSRDVALDAFAAGAEIRG